MDVDCVRTSTRGYKGIGLNAIVHAVPGLDTLFSIHFMHGSAFPERGRIKVIDRQIVFDEAKHLFPVESIRVFRTARAIRNTDHFGIFPILSKQDFEFVPSDVSIRPSCYFDRKRFFLGINLQDMLKRDVQVDIHSFGSHTVFLVIDARARLARHERSWSIVATLCCSLDNPVNIFRDDLLIRTKVQYLLLSNKVNNLLSRLLRIHNQIQNSIHKSLHRLSHHEIPPTTRHTYGINQHNRLRPTLGNILILELLRIRQSVTFIVLVCRFQRELLGGGGRDETHPSSSNISESNVVAVESSSVREDDSVRCFASGGVTFGCHDFWIET
mmetsp:Transcript_12086/g.21826  ORF Transcript_12086/g.21826 Transcript_12086/m.21826 type:complete len:327 (+) Transcript_12086:1020-2000(+)